MTKAEFEELGLTAEQYEEMFDEKPVLDDDVQAAEVTEAAVEVPEFAEETAVEAPVVEQPKVKKSKKAKKAEPVTDDVAAIVPTEAKAEVAVAGEAMSFKNIKAAAEYLATQLNLKVTNTLDGLYKTIRRGSNKTHGYTVVRNEDSTVVLTPIA